MLKYINTYQYILNAFISIYINVYQYIIYQLISMYINKYLIYIYILSIISYILIYQ